MRLKEIADKIHAHLQRFEHDPEINKKISLRDSTLKTYFWTGARAAGNRVFVTYVSYQGPCSLTKTKAEQYLSWLEAGGVGNHYDMECSKS